MQQLATRLTDQSLLCQHAFVAGSRVNSSNSGKTFEVRNPSTNSVLAILPDLGKQELAIAIDAAHEAQAHWELNAGPHKSALLKKWFHLWIDSVDDLAAILTAEQGKPFAEAKSEVLEGAALLEWYAEEAKRIYGDTFPGHQGDNRLIVFRVPVGVVGAFTPWNFPSGTLAKVIAPALATGCAIVSKPAEETPLSTLAIATLAERAGLPMELFSVITSTQHAELTSAMLRSQKIAKISFNGSTEVGRVPFDIGPEQCRKLNADHKGDAPMIVFDDADIAAAVEGTISSKFRNSGQTFVSTNKIFVQSNIVETFSEKLAARVNELNVGDGFNEDSDVGPVVSRKKLAQTLEQIEDALAKGAHVVSGGLVHDAGPLYFHPTVLINVSDDMLFAREEPVGPVVPIFSFETEEEVIARANGSDYNIAAFFFAQNIARVIRVTDALKATVLGVNTGVVTSGVSPYGSIIDAGVGREGSRYGIDEFLKVKHVCFGGVTQPPSDSG